MATTYVPVATQTLGSAASSVTFSSIPATYTDLVLVISARGTTAAASTSVYFTTNITGSNYSSTWLVGNGSAVATSRYSSTGQGYLGYVSAGTTNASSRGNIIAHFMNYSNTTTGKTVISRGNVADAETAAYVSRINGTSAISTITIGEGGGNNFVAGSTFSLYGIASAAVVSGVKATGGDVVATDGTYWYHAFRTSGTFTPTQTLSCDVLQIAGGGGGSGSNGYSGGGAGGLVYTTANSFSTAQTVTIGGGGASATAGTNTTIGSLTAAVGGGRGGAAGTTGGNGGSGGGGGDANSGGGPFAGGTATSGQGFAGGSGTAGFAQGGGGGGAGGAGNAGNTATPNGGAGTTTYSSWGAVTGTGVSVTGTYYFATGGSAGTGGTKTGGGVAANSGNGGNWNESGSSGLVIVRYAV